ncbi:MAG: phage holin family protein [Candidatus Wildermuthbacteria bacterium]|nr:phage holin family protein [Candidatus Wildermuthbacteria bacterium]
MKIIQKFALLFVANATALYLTTLLVDGVSIPLKLESFALVVATLSLIHLFIRPLIRIAFTPLIILTLGLASILVNALTLFILDLILPTVAIVGFLPLFLTTLIVSITSTIFAATSKR